MAPYEDVTLLLENAVQRARQEGIDPDWIRSQVVWVQGKSKLAKSYNDTHLGSPYERARVALSTPSRDALRRCFCNLAPSTRFSPFLLEHKTVGKWLTTTDYEQVNKWRTSKGTPPVNLDLFLALDSAVSLHESKGVEVGFWHIARRYNDTADCLAKGAAVMGHVVI